MKRLNITIKNMLTGLVFVGVLAILALAGVSSSSSQRLIRSQNRLTEIVIPLEAANQRLRVAMASLSDRQSRMIGVISAEAFDALMERRPLEDDFRKNLDRLLQTLSVERADAGQEKASLPGEYKTLLEKDDALQTLVRDRLELETSVNQQIAVMDEKGNALQESGEKVAGWIKFAALQEKAALREYVDRRQTDTEVNSAVRDMLQVDLTRPQEICNTFRIRIAALATFGRQILLTESTDRIAEIQETRIQPGVMEIRNALDELKKSFKTSERMTRVLLQIESDFTEFHTALTEIDGLRVRLIKVYGDIARLRDELRTRIAGINKSLNNLQAISLQIREQVDAEADGVRLSVAWFVWGTAVVSVLVMIFAGVLIARRIIGPIDRAVDFADTIAEGDLTARIQMDEDDNELLARFRLNRDDEIGRLMVRLGEMARSLNNLIAQVQRSGVQVSSSATELAAAARQQEGIMSKQVESTGHVVRSITRISKISDELGETMQQVAAMSGETARFAEHGQEDLNRMEEAIGRMEKASGSISAKLEVIDEKASNITSVVTTITKVADQTNLLSLNAAIEAEKAGEQGRGFMVVAREIRRLADQTAVSTLDIGQMVREMQSAVSTGVMEMEAFMKEVQRSAGDVARISGQLGLIIEQVRALSPSFDNVNQSMQVQTENARNISDAMQRLGDDLQQTLESLQESFQAIEQLNEAARGLHDEVSRFKVV